MYQISLETLEYWVLVLAVLLLAALSVLVRWLRLKERKAEREEREIEEWHDHLKDHAGIKDEADEELPAPPDADEIRALDE